MKPDPRCIIDRERPCRGCIASSPIDCPYPYLLASDEEQLDAMFEESYAGIDR